MYELIRVGVPARRQDITQSFLDAISSIKNGTAIGLITVDLNNSETKFEYLSAPYGYQHIIKELELDTVNSDLKYFVLNTYANIWNIHGGSTPNNSIDNLLKYFDDQHNKLNFKKLYFLTCGSPYISDAVTSILIQKRTVSVIDAESPIRICSNNMKEYLNVDDYAIHSSIPYTLERNMLHVLPCISKNYGINITELFNLLNEQVKQSDIFLYSTILEDGSSYVKSMSFKQALEDILFFQTTEKNLTYGIYTNDNSRTICSNIS